LLGIVTPGARLPSLAGNRMLYRDGLPVAIYAAGEVQFLEKLEPQEEWEARNAVLRRHVPAALIALDDPG
jgi:ATP-dependent Lhr-like helicase